MSEKTEKKRFKFNFIDIILIVIIIAAAAFLGHVILSGRADNTSDDSFEIEYDIQIGMMREEFRGLINIGDNVIESGSLNSIGEVVDVTYAEATYTGTNRLEGRLAYSSYIGFYKVTVTVRATATEKNGICYVNGHEIIVGSPIEFRMPAFTASGYFSSMNSAPDER